MGFSEATVYAKVALPWIIVGFIFHIVGFPTDSWADTNGGNVGLFKICGDSLGCIDVVHDSYPDWFKTSLAFEILGFIFMLLTVILLLVYVVAVNNNKILRALTIVCDSLAVIFIFIGFVVYAGRFGELWSETLYDLGWSFALVVVSHVCLFIGLICLFLDLCIPNSDSHRLSHPHA